MKLTSESIQPGAPIPPRFAFARPDRAEHAALAPNRSPHLAWSEIPEGARSFVFLCVDVDVPTVGEDVNQEGRTVSSDLPRTDFVHWVMVDVPGSLRELEDGAVSDGVTPHGKARPTGPEGARQGVNDYTSWFEGDPDMDGTYLGYDGPAPPWNDERLHHYQFRVHALDVERLDVPEPFRWSEVQAAMVGHVLATAEIVGTYTMNPDLAG